MKKTLLTLTSILALLFFTACGSDEKKVEEKEVKLEEKSSMEVIKEASSKVGATLGKTVEEVSSTVSTATKEVVEKTTPVIEQKAKEVVQTVEKSVEKVKTAVAPKKEIDGVSLYASCASCHGQDASKAALGKSKVIKGWSKEEVLNALNGYKNGTYGGPMKGIMKGQVANKSAEELEALAQYIASFK